MDGESIGHARAHSLFDTHEYEVEFMDGAHDKYQASVHDQIQMSKAHLWVSFEVVWFVGCRYVEQRQTRIQQEQLTDEEIRWAEETRCLEPRGEVDLEACFRDKQGDIKPFKLFKEGDFLYHTYGGVEERTPSGKVFHGGFRCFGCNTMFVVPWESPWEKPYEFLPGEIVQGQERQQMPDIDWGTLQKSKFIIISAPMGTGKMFQAARLVDKIITNETCEGEKVVLSVMFWQMLATQLASIFGIVDYQALCKEHWPEAASLCIMLNLLPAVALQ